MTSFASFIQEITPEQLPSGEATSIILSTYARVKDCMKTPFVKAMRSTGCGLSMDGVTGAVIIQAWFVDSNNHKHTFSLTYYHKGISGGLLPQVTCQYLWDGVVETTKGSCNSFAEYLMLKLWHIKIDVELTNCDRGLRVNVPIDEDIVTMQSMIELTASSIKPISWFTDKYEGWIFYPVYGFLVEDLILDLQDEADKDRWRNMTPSNFYIKRAEDHALLCVEYYEAGLYNITFSVGLRDGSFSLPNIYKYLDIEFEVENLAESEEVRKYMDDTISDFLAFTKAYMQIAFSYHALFASSDTGFFVIVERQWAFNKFCLLLDLFSGLAESYQSEEPLVTPVIRDVISVFEETLGGIELTQEDDSLRIFAHGKYKTTTIDDDDNMDNGDTPF